MSYLDFDFKSLKHFQTEDVSFDELFLKINTPYESDVKI